MTNRKTETCPNCGTEGSRSPLAELHKPLKDFCTACNYITSDGFGNKVFLCSHCGEGTFTEGNGTCTKCGKNVYEEFVSEEKKARIKNVAIARAEAERDLADAKAKGDKKLIKRCEAALKLVGIWVNQPPDRDAEADVEKLQNALMNILLLRLEDNGNICADAVEDACIMVLCETMNKTTNELTDMLRERARNMDSSFTYET